MPAPTMEEPALSAPAMARVLLASSALTATSCFVTTLTWSPSSASMTLSKYVTAKEPAAAIEKLLVASPATPPLVPPLAPLLMTEPAMAST